MSFEIPKNSAEEAVRRADDAEDAIALYQGYDCLAVRARSARAYTRFIVNLGEVLDEIGMTGGDYMWQLADVAESDADREILADDDGITTYYFPGVAVTE